LLLSLASHRLLFSCLKKGDGRFKKRQVQETALTKRSN
jgi:hypothetical protein